MASPNPSLLHTQLSRARRRLFFQALCETCAWGWTIALLVTAAWLVLDKRYPLPAALGSCVGRSWEAVWALGTLVAVVLALWRTPSLATVALLLDEKFGLKERVTTLLLLEPEQVNSPAGAALLADVQERLARLDVASRFPVRLSWTSALVPLCLALLVALSYLPRAQAGSQGEEASATTTSPVVENTAKVDELKKKLAERYQERKKDPAHPEEKGDEDIDPDLMKFLKKDHKTEEEFRRGVQELGELEKKKQDQLAAEKARRQDMAEQLKQLDRLAKKQPDNKPEQKEGPAKDLNKALGQGKLEEAKKEAERLSKKLKEDQLNKKEEEELQRQLEEEQRKLDRLARQEDKREELEQLHNEGKLDDEALKREKEQLDREEEEMKDAKDLAKEMRECKECMNKGDKQKAAQAMQKAGKKLEEMEKKEKAQQSREKQVREELQQVRQLRKEMRQAMGKPMPGEGRRPIAKSGDTDSVDSREKGELDKHGQFVLDGYAPGKNYKKAKPSEVEGQVKQAKQEASQALERQPIPKAYRKEAKEYYDNLGGQKP